MLRFFETGSAYIFQEGGRQADWSIRNGYCRWADHWCKALL